MDITSIISLSTQAIDLAVKAHEQYPSFMKFFNSFRKPIRVLIVGESGSGKSQFLLTIQGKKEFSNDRTTLSQCCVLKLPNGRRVEFWDTPGHQTLKPERGRKLNEISRKRFDGIVNLVCYGYQSADDINPTSIYQGGEIKESFLKDNREKELKQMKEWLERIDGESGVKWVLTIINKADVWWEQNENVIKHYVEGSEYYEELKTLSKMMTISAIPYCSVISPLFGRPMTLIFGEKEKHFLHIKLCQHLSNLIGLEWHK